MEEITAAFLQSAAMINGCQQNETNIVETKLPGGKFYETANEVIILVKGKVTRIPKTNVKSTWPKMTDVEFLERVSNDTRKVGRPPKGTTPPDQQA